MEELKQVISKYKAIDDRLKEVNNIVYDLREKRKIVELEMIDYLKSDQFANINKLVVSSDNSVIKIDRNPTKPWYLSKSNLKELMQEYFMNTTQPTAEGCYTYVVSKQIESLKSTEFAFTRTIPSSMEE